MMSKTEKRIIQNVISRLKADNCGCHNDFGAGPIEKQIKAYNEENHSSSKLELVSRRYLDTWVIPALKLSAKRRLRSSPSLSISSSEKYGRY